jgi:branched-chain amino acid transport system ATP-binding protein
MAKPRLLMLDEPSLGLAPLVVREIFAIIERLRAQGVSILLVEQNARAGLAISNTGAVMDSGTVVLEAPGAELLADPKMAELYLGGRVAPTAAG